MSAFESIYVGFWKHVSAIVLKTVPSSKQYNLHYAILSLTTAIITFLQSDPSDTEVFKKKAAAVLYSCVHINICIMDSVAVRYDPPALADRPCIRKLLEYLALISEAGTHYEINIEADPHHLFSGPYLANKIIEKAIFKILQCLTSYTGGTLRELAICLQREYDPIMYLVESSSDRGLEHLPVEYW
jgi:hypothetical protein